MSEQVGSTPVSGQAQEVAPPVPGSTEVMKSSTGEEFTGASTFSSLENFRKRFPEMYDKFMRSAAETAIRDMKKGAERVKKALKKMRE